MTSCFHIMCQLQIQAWSSRRGEWFTVTRHATPLNYAPGDEVCYRRFSCLFWFAAACSAKGASKRLVDVIAPLSPKYDLMILSLQNSFPSAPDESQTFQRRAFRRPGCFDLYISVDISIWRKLTQRFTRTLLHDHPTSVIFCVCLLSLWADHYSVMTGNIFTAHSELREVLFLASSVCFLFVYEISRESLNRFAPNSHGRRVCSIARTSFKVKVRGQGHKGQKHSCGLCSVKHL